ncbi:MAG TPA: alpha/beta hydrolase-fold protein [Acidimicrobiia bacterium]|nr:alpha/beta hydrolase-fold protein [Acidimicrobiia bacterium]
MFRRRSMLLTLIIVPIACSAHSEQLAPGTSSISATPLTAGRSANLSGVTAFGARRDGSVPAHGRIEVLSVRSADRDVTVRDVWVYRPAVPDSATLPVVYFLHGVPGTAADVFSSGTAEALDRMFASGVQPFVLAAPTGTGTFHADTEWADSEDGADRLETYIVDEVISAVEGAHRRDRRNRIIAGFSMGGYGAANLALRHPALFGAVASFAGYFHIDDPDSVFGGDRQVESANDPELLIKTVRDVRFWLAEGTSDTEPAVRGEALRFAALAGSLVGPHDLVVAPGAHDYAFVVAHLADMGAFIARGDGDPPRPSVGPS